MRLIIAFALIVGGTSLMIWTANNPTNPPYRDTVAGTFALADGVVSCNGDDNVLFTISGKGELMSLSPVESGRAYHVCVKDVGE